MQEKNQLKEKISSISSLSYFHQSQICIFKNEIESQLCALVDCSCILLLHVAASTAVVPTPSSTKVPARVPTTCSSSSCCSCSCCCSATKKLKCHYYSNTTTNVPQVESNIVHYTPAILEDCINTCFEWKQLCKNHNDECEKKKHGRRASSATALELIFAALTNQSVIPYCFTHSITVGMFHIAEKSILQSSSLLTFTKKNKYYQVQVEKYLQQSIITSSVHTMIFIMPSSISTRLISSTIQSLLDSRHKAISLANTFNLYVSQSEVFKSKMNFFQPLTKKGKKIKQHLKIHYSETQIIIVIEMLIFMTTISCAQKQKNPQTTFSSLKSLVIIILKLFSEIDDIDIAMLRRRQRKILHVKSSRKSNNMQLCTQCKMIYNSQPTRTKRSCTTTTSHYLSALHGELSDEEEQKYSSGLSRKLQSNKSHYFLSNHDGGGGDDDNDDLGSFSLKGLASKSNQIKKFMKDKMSCYICKAKDNRNTSQHNITTLPIHLVYYRAFLFHLLVDIIKLLSMHDIHGLKRILHQALSFATKYSQSSSIRYCALIMTHYIDIHVEEGYYKRLLAILSSSYKAYSSSSTSTMNSSNPQIFLNMYCEIIIECSFFNDVKECWLALKTLIDELIPSLECETDDSLIPKQLGTTERFMLQSVAYVLLKRNFVALQKKMTNETLTSFNECILKFSELFSDPEIWMHPNMTQFERSKTILMLQQLGVLSFLQSNFDDDDKSLQHTHETWPYLESIRDVSKRIGPKVQCTNIFTETTETNNCLSSDGNDDDDTPPPPKRKEKDDIYDEDSIIDYINEDITRHIFSFLGYKLLVRVTAVCKLWNEIGNENCFWKVHYKKRFNIVLLHEYLPKDIDDEMKLAFIAKYCNEKDLKWRQLFDDKWKKERTLGPRALRRRDKGWIVKTCDLLGCLTVLQSKNRQEKHFSMHRNDALKKLRQLQRLKERNEKRVAKKRKLNKDEGL